ncbi:hypothetical protein PybrP1_012430 [[Pythium] brassicae (nom. inval.)]|nr:hypothetical protein PybrP1_012430 [[Pythium] brassicae (nom. inval.)]
MALASLERDEAPAPKALAGAAALSGGLLLLLLQSRRRSVSARHKRIVAGASALNDFVAKSLQPALDSYSPAWWTNAHVQVFLPFVLPQPRLAYKRDVLVMKDGGHTSLDWVVEASAPPSLARRPLRDDSPIALVMHGLTGGSESMRSLCAAALAGGYRPVVFNKRGHGGLKLATPTLQAFGDTADLKEGIAQIERAFPASSQLYGIGYSAGAGLLCSYLGETGDASRIAAGVFISPGYDAVELFCRGRVHRFYDVLMTFTLKRLLLTHREELRGVVDLPAALRATSVAEFDKHVYAKMHGFASAEAYWARNDPLRAIGAIRRPVLCINALDDPVCAKETIPYAHFAASAVTMLVETGEGSHCAFFEGALAPESWANKAAVAYLDGVREFQHGRQAAAAPVAAAAARDARAIAAPQTRLVSELAQANQT